MARSTKDRDQLHQKLEALRTEHRDLDEVLSRLADTSVHDQLQIRRLKKRKLVLKDQIAQIEDILYPDIIA